MRKSARARGLAKGRVSRLSSSEEVCVVLGEGERVSEICRWVCQPEGVLRGRGGALRRIGSLWVCVDSMSRPQWSRGVSSNASNGLRDPATRPPSLSRCPDKLPSPDKLIGSVPRQSLPPPPSEIAKRFVTTHYQAHTPPRRGAMLASAMSPYSASEPWLLQSSCPLPTVP